MYVCLTAFLDDMAYARYVLVQRSVNGRAYPFTEWVSGPLFLHDI